MSFFFQIICSTIVAFSLVVSCFGRLGVVEEYDMKIIGGTQATRGQFPFVVKILGNKECTASLVTLTQIVTAAHCMASINRTGHSFYLNLTTAQVIGGMVYFTNVCDKYCQSRRIASYQLHPKYGLGRCGRSFHDVSVASLTRSFDPSRTVRPMSVISGNPDKVRQSWECLAGVKACVSVGWGVTGYLIQKETLVPTNPSRYLKVLDVIPLPYEVCKFWYCPDENDPSMVCATTPYQGLGHGLSSGDSGGPVICDGKVYGVYTRSYRDPKFRSPFVFFLLPMYLEEFSIVQDDKGFSMISNQVDSNHLWILLLLLIFCYQAPQSK